MSNWQYKFTIFTPCFNSEKFIHRVFNSLNKQTYRNFEWLVINDGSTDNTSKLIRDFISKSDFDIQYFDLEKNQMLTKNYNLAIRNAKGEFFLPAGHDDEFIPEALEKFMEYWDKYGSGEFSGISCLCLDQYGNIVGDLFPDSPYFSNYFNVVYNKHIKGEKWGFTRTDVIKKFLLPEDIDVYISESLIWAGIGKSYKTIYMNDALRIYYLNQENHTGLSNINKKQIKYPYGIRYKNLQMINNYKKLIKGNQIAKFKFFLDYIRVSYITNMPVIKMIEDIHNFFDKIAFLMILPIGKLVYLRDKKRRSI